AMLAAGCTVNEARETAAYRNPLDEKIPPAAAQLAPGEVLSLPRALAMANYQNERLAMSGEDYVQSLIERDRSASKLMPSIGIGATYTKLETFAAPSFVGTFFPNPFLDVPVHTGLVIDLSNVADVEKNAVLAQYRLALLLNLQADILVATGETYYQILSLERQVAVLAESVKVQENRVADVRARVKAGVARQLDQREGEAQAAGTRASLIDSRNKLATARAGLAFLVGVASVDNPLADGFEVPAVPPLEESQKQATLRRHEVLASQALVAAAEKALQAAYADYLPTVSLDFEYFLSKQSFPPDSRWIFGVGANLPIFSGGRLYAGLRTAYSLMRQAAAYNSLTRRQVAEQVKVAYGDLEAAGDRLKEYEAQVAAARDAFQLSDQAYIAGISTNLDRLIVQDRLQQAELQLAAEVLNRKIMYLRLVRQVGELVDEANHLGTPAAGAQAAALTAENAENAEKKMIK
ncbi:MAG: TolC family protein, partial [Planctomycetota bacterium]|nr:TolC family protein [Planctomycetota bacterium]